MSLRTTDPQWVMILQYETADADVQRELIDGLAGMVDEWVTPYAGLLGARFHASEDGKRVVNTVMWETEAAYRAFLAESDNEARVAALGELFERLGERVKWVEGAAPGHHVVRTVVPGAAAKA